MTDATTVDTEAPSTSGHTATRGAPAETGPDGPFGRLPPSFLRSAVKRHGSVFAINVPFFGRSVVVSDPASHGRCSWRAPMT